MEVAELLRAVDKTQVHVTVDGGDVDPPHPRQRTLPFATRHHAGICRVGVWIPRARPAQRWEGAAANSLPREVRACALRSLLSS